MVVVPRPTPLPRRGYEQGPAVGRRLGPPLTDRWTSLKLAAMPPSPQVWVMWAESEREKAVGAKWGRIVLKVLKVLRWGKGVRALVVGKRRIANNATLPLDC